MLSVLAFTTYRVSVSHTAPCVLRVLTHLILTAILEGRHYSHPHFTDDETNKKHETLA